MNRSEYFSQTKEQFNSSAIESSFFPNHFDPLIGVYRVLEIIADDGQHHPRFTGVPFVIKCKCIWKAELKDDFLEEFNHWFDLTELLKDWEKLPALPSDFIWDYNSKTQVFHLAHNGKTFMLQILLTGCALAVTCFSCCIRCIEGTKIVVSECDLFCCYR